MNKKIIVVILFGSLIGYLFGSIIFNNYKGKDYIKEDGNIYYLQYGVYTTNEAAINNTKNLNEKYIVKELDNKYYVYLGITSNYNLALKLKDKYEKKNIHIYIRSDYLENSETLDKIKEYDSKINDENIETVMKEILENDELNL